MRPLSLFFHQLLHSAFKTLELWTISHRGCDCLDLRPHRAVRRIVVVVGVAGTTVRAFPPVTPIVWLRITVVETFLTVVTPTGGSACRPLVTLSRPICLPSASNIRTTSKVRLPEINQILLKRR
jgi:hypothetical protein